MSSILEFLWLFCAAWWIFTIFILWRPKLKKLSETSELSTNDILLFQKNIALAITIPCILLQIMQFFGGYKLPIFLLEGKPISIWGVASYGITFISWGLLLFWIWMKSGAEYLSKFAPILNIPKNPRAIKYLIILFLLIVAASGIIKIFSN